MCIGLYTVAIDELIVALMSLRIELLKRKIAASFSYLPILKHSAAVRLSLCL